MNVPLNAFIMTDEPTRYTTIFVVSSNVPIFTKATSIIMVMMDSISFILPWLPIYLYVLSLSLATSRIVRVDNPKSVNIAKSPDIAVANDIIPKFVVPRYLAEYKV